MVWNNASEVCDKLELNVLCSWPAWFTVQDSRNCELNHHTMLRWSPSGESKLKCNVDASFNIIWGPMNRGLCVRNHLGNFVLVGAAWDFGSYSILEVEALSLEEAMQIAIEMQLEQVIFESDSQRTTQAISSIHHGFSEFNLSFLLLEGCCIIFLTLR
ncbi:uncharacterized protein LOC131651990 [Vicia villosa]|uniref:uncharacterized protein LOC131651990 n=1 Tax=Vicia villosa TaxID=3911 RepID=UPI00273B59D8|nr:uncharacterized protein LOC131651990 [Vicia villosa]